MADDHPAPDRAFVRFGSSTGLTHLPGLDGLRGLAVAVVVLFHGNWDWARGGFLGVSLFFTLSGFLITSLLISEHRRHEHVDLAAFWGRRFRRLLPAAWLTLAVVVVTSVALGEFTSAARVDVWASLGNIANWRFLAAGTSYNDLFAQPSPVRHFWSLAIEEQCYLVVPFVVGVALRFGRGRLRSLGLVLGGLFAASVAATFLVSGADRVYYGTDTRAAELLIGALLAVVVAHEPFRRRLTVGLWPRWVLQVAAGLAFVATVAAWGLVAVSDPIVSDGGLVVMGLLSSVLVLSAAVGVGPVALLLRASPLRFLGRISYGVYLFHWPLFVFLTERRTGLEHAPRFVLQVALAVVLATLSHRYFEQPLRRVSLQAGSLDFPFVATLVAVLVLAGTLMIDMSGRSTPGFDAELAHAQLRQLSQSAPAESSTTTVPSPAGAGAAPAAPVEPAAPVAEAPPSVAMFGDSISLSIAFSLNPWSLRSGQVRFLGGDTEMGCGIGRGGREDGISNAPRTAFCDGWQPRWQQFTDAQRPDIAVVQSSQWELVDRRLSGDDTWRSLGDPVYDDFLRSEFLAATDVLASDGALVVWANVPYFSRLDDDALPAGMRKSHDPARVDRLNEIIRDVVAARPAQARLVDLAAWMSDKVDDQALRKDGAHFNDSGAERVASEFLGPRLVAIWRDWHRAGAGIGDG